MSPFVGRGVEVVSGEMFYARALRVAFILVVLGAFVTVGAARAPAAGTSKIRGVAFFDLNGDGVKQAAEVPASDHRLYLFDAEGTYLAKAATDTDGAYVFTGLVDGDYRVEYDATAWSPLKDEWVPTTTGSVWPRVTVSLSGSANVDFGWRPIVWSTDITAPISSHEGPEGLRVESFNDAVGAREVHDAVLSGLVGLEAPVTTVRFAYGTSSWTSTGVVEVDGAYRDFHANVYVTYGSWLGGWDQTLSHEYGHAWSLYHSYMTQGDDTMAGYLEARGLAGDDRVDSSYVWGRRELIAEDYRQLFGSPNAQARPQANREIPPAADVPGLREYLADVFTQPPVTEEPVTEEPVTEEPAAEEPVTEEPATSTTEESGTTAEEPAVAIEGLSMTLTKRDGTATFTVTAPAAATVQILTGDGAVVRSLARRLDVPGGEQIELDWDRSDDAGKRVRRGSYVLRVDVVDEQGRTDTAEVGFEI